MMKGRRVITVDARNHGESPHTTHMTYLSMAAACRPQQVNQVSPHIMSLLYIRSCVQLVRSACWVTVWGDGLS